MLRGARYDQAGLNRAWQAVLLNQFHDILPGSHIEKGFTDAVEAYRQAFDRLDEIKAKALRAIGGARAAAGRQLAIFNSLLWPRAATLELAPAPGVPCDSDGIPLPCQTVSTESGRKLLVQVPAIPAGGFRAIRFEKSAKAPAQRPLRVDAGRLENEHIRLRLDKNGEIVSLYDKTARRECIARGEKANRFQLFEDNPGKYDAWDIARQYEKRRWDIVAAESVRVVESGPLRATIEVTKRFSKSVLRQRFSLEAGARWVDSTLWLDWHEDFRLLKVAFPVNVSAKKAAYQIPYGVIERSTCDANRWDKAKFEAPAQMWVDLSERTHGFSLINDCKYGFDIKGHVIRMTLLKAPKFPNPKSDRHEHTLAFRLYPHAGGWREGETWQQAQAFNTPPTVMALRRGQALPAPLLAWQGRSIVQLEACKKAEDSNDVIVRLREVCGESAAGLLKLGFTAARVVETNMIEDEIRSLNIKGRNLRLRLKPHQVLTLKIRPA
jgi:alpha-mannosidase